MIELTRINGVKFILNCEFIESLEQTPDTVISTTTGKKFVVAEKVDEVVEKVIEYKRKIFCNLMSID
jgi:flagellar protein FlbD